MHNAAALVPCSLPEPVQGLRTPCCTRVSTVLAITTALSKRKQLQGLENGLGVPEANFVSGEQLLDCLSSGSKSQPAPPGVRRLDIMDGHFPVGCASAASASDAHMAAGTASLIASA